MSRNLPQLMRIVDQHSRNEFEDYPRASVLWVIAFGKKKTNSKNIKIMIKGF